ncbi:MAG TPA: hypothetical protein VNU46_04040, partial [Gemmatimonadaceae bacterium]|nr:hypothetical protein [Gemmatimonadaceae bacterium]
MRTYRGRDAHLRAMPHLAAWVDEAAVVHWEQSDHSLPSSAEVAERLRSTGRLSKVRHPTPAHSAGETWPDGRPARWVFTLS